MPTDPKWRVIARRSGQRLGDVIAMFSILMVQAGANASERGRTHGNDDEDIAAALDLEADDVAAIRAAMQGKVLDGDMLAGWEKRQPKREDGGAADRAKRWRESKKTDVSGDDANDERKRTQANAQKRPDAETDAEADADIPPKGGKRATALRDDFEPVLTEAASKDAEAIGATKYGTELVRFRDHHRARGTAMKDWQAAWRTWLSRAVEYQTKGQANGQRGGTNGRAGNGDDHPGGRTGAAADRVFGPGW